MDNKKIVSNTKPILSTLFVIVTFLTISFVLMVYLHHQFVLNTIIEEEQSIASKIYTNTFKNITKRYHSVATDIFMNKQIIDAFEKKDRKELLKLTAPIYEKLTKENQYIKIMHFHTKETKSFLRLHKPEKFDDDLSSIRHMINKVNDIKVKQTAMEAGRHGVYYRLAFPVFNGEGYYLGAFEVGFNLNYILDTFNQDYGFESLLLLKKDIFNIIYEHNKNITFKSYSNDYYSIESDIDKKCGCNKDEPCTCLSSNTCNCANTSVCTCITPTVNSNTPSIVEDSDSSKMVFTVNTIKDISNKEIGKILFVKNLDFYTDKINNVLVLIVLSVLVLLLISFYMIRKIFNSYIRVIQNYQSKLEIKNRTLLKLSNIDHLTKVHNRKSIESILIKELKRGKRYNQELSLIIFDIDNFKQINDTYGHNAGDKVLRNIAKIVTASIRETDSFGRWGGEEFIIVSPVTSLENASIVAEKTRQNIYAYDFEEIGKVSCSVGVAEYADGDDYQKIVHNADTALYEAKHSGKNRVVVYKKSKLK